MKLPQQLVLDMGLTTGPTLDNYLAGPNAQALAHLRLWLGQGRAARSPLPTYLWGEPGCGKTHLLGAVRAALAQVEQSVGWLDAGSADDLAFDADWAAVLLDDVHAFDVAQQQLAFNWFVNAQTQQIAVLAAGSLPPADLKLRDDLRTRLGWGHVFALQALGEAQRRSVLRQQASVRGVDLSDEVVDFMLTRFSRDLGSLMELLDLMDGYALQTQRAITIPLIKTMMDNACFPS
ncbi:MAG: DnaA regulatory inactivator Hda, partial [Rhodoferax sp.]|nr:DnaA regulatory inactivator Hda [Rhodoferax sp.]